MMTLRIKYNITLLFSPPGRKQRADSPGPGVFGSVAPCTRSRCGANTAIPQWLPSGGQEYNPLWSGHSFRPIFLPDTYVLISESQSPLVGASGPVIPATYVADFVLLSQSPLIGASVMTKEDGMNQRIVNEFQSPLIGASVMTPIRTLRKYRLA